MSTATPASVPFRPKKRGRGLGWIVAAVLGLAVVGFLLTKRYAPKDVTVSPVVRGTAIDAVYATGTVESFERAIVKARVAGTITDFKVREGDRVKKGDLLASIDSPVLQFDLQRGKSDMRAANSQAGANAPQVEALEAQTRATDAQLGVARTDRDRVQRLADTGSVTRAELDRANAQVSTLEAQLAAQKAQRRSLVIDLGARASGASVTVDSLAAKVADTEVRASLDGVVLSRSVETGELVSAGQQILRIGDIGDLILECQLDEADVAKVHVGSRAAVSLYAFPERVVQGEVFDVFPDADRTRKSFLTKVRLQNGPDGLRSGMSAEVNVILGEHANVLLGPAEAIDASGEAWVVKDGRAEKRVLVTGLRDLLRVEIVSGAAENETLVVAGSEALSPGARVRATLKPIDPRASRPSRPKMTL